MNSVAYLVSEYPTVSTTFILREVRQLRKKGLHIEVASINESTPPKDGWPDEEQQEFNSTFFVKKQGYTRAFFSLVKVTLFHPIQVLKSFGKALFFSKGTPLQILRMGAYFLQACAIGSWMQKKELNHLHVHFGNAGATVALFVHEIFRYPFSMTVHGPDIFYDSQRYLLKEKIEKACWIACITQFCRSQLLFLSSSQFQDKLFVLPLGIDTQSYLPKKDYDPKDPLQLVCVGRAVQAKGGYDLLYAFAKAIKKYPLIKLTYVGDGPELEKMKKLAEQLQCKKAITFTGALGREKTREVLQNSDVFILPSYAEGLPVALMEAMSCQIPCISTYIAGIPELIKNGYNGYLIPAGDQDQLSNAILAIKEDAEKRNTMGKKARETVMEKHCLNKNTDALFQKFIY